MSNLQKSTEKHLEEITVDSILDFRSKAFNFLAFFTSKEKGKISIGVNAVGQFIVRTAEKDFIYNNPAMAVEKYRELLTL